MNRKLQTARALSLGDWLTLAQAWLLLLIADLGLRVLPFPRVQAFATPDLPREPRAVTPPPIQRLHRLVDIAARHHVYPMTCLRRALVLQRLLRARGADAHLRIGVRKDAGALGRN
ncbi:MAG: lasso peptide biosynthesis B2 protein [Chloroflexi bacterium]|nr:lasso peptide biosynthesis B2 protein [Chloroflexota bacterium]